MYKERLNTAIEKRDYVLTIYLVSLQTPTGPVYLVREKRDYVCCLSSRETATRRNTAITKRNCVLTMYLVSLQTPRGPVYLVREKRDYVCCLSSRERRDFDTLQHTAIETSDYGGAIISRFFTNISLFCRI